MKETRPIVPGSVVRSKAGRDAGRYFVVMGFDGEDFVWLCDGKLRGIERQKRKRRRHLYVTEAFVSGFQERLKSGDMVKDHEIRAWLQALTQEEE